METTKVKIWRTGGGSKSHSLGIIIPKALAETLNLKVGMLLDCRINVETKTLLYQKFLEVQEDDK